MREREGREEIIWRKREVRRHTSEDVKYRELSAMDEACFPACTPNGRAKRPISDARNKQKVFFFSEI